MPSSDVASYAIAAIIVVLGIPLMSYSSAQLDNIKDKAARDKSPWIAGVVFGVLLIVGGILFAVYTFFNGKGDATAQVGNSPSAVAGSATAPAGNQNPIVALKHAKQNEANALKHKAERSEEVANMANKLNQLTATSEA